MPPVEPSLEALRTARQTLLIGADNQAKLHDSTVLIVGAGGLGCPILQQLAAAGVGHIVLVDDDTVDVTNIHRQILFGAADVGAPKVAVAARRARELQPGLDIQTHQVRFDTTNALELLKGVDLVLDGSDSFATKYLVADACEITGTPLVWGTVLRFHGDVALWHSGPSARGVGLRDLFPTQLSADSVPDCATAGVLGVTTAVIGGLMATAAIGWLTGLDRTVGQLTSYDALPPRLRTLTVTADPARALVTALGQYTDDSAGEHAGEPATGCGIAARQHIAYPVLDIREPAEILLAPAPVPTRELPAQAFRTLSPAAQAAALAAACAGLDAATPVAVACASGRRSAAFIADFQHLTGIKLVDVPGGIGTLSASQKWPD